MDDSPLLAFSWMISSFSIPHFGLKLHSNLRPDVWQTVRIPENKEKISRIFLYIYFYFFLPLHNINRSIPLTIIHIIEYMKPHNKTETSGVNGKPHFISFR